MRRRSDRSSSQGSGSEDEPPRPDRSLHPPRAAAPATAATCAAERRPPLPGRRHSFFSPCVLSLPSRDGGRALRGGARAAQVPTLDLQTAKGVMKFEFRTAAEMHDWWVDLVHIQHNCKMIHYEKTGAPCPIVARRRRRNARRRIMAARRWWRGRGANDGGSSRRRVARTRAPRSSRPLVPLVALVVGQTWRVAPARELGQSQTGQCWGSLISTRAVRARTVDGRGWWQRKR